MTAASAGAAGALPPDLCASLAALASAAGPHLADLDAEYLLRLDARGCDPPEKRALAAISAGAALRFFGGGGDAAGFAERIEYHGRRLAKLNLPPEQVLSAFSEYPILRVDGAGPVLERLRLAVALGVHMAFYQVRESETQAFYGLFRAEAEADGLDALLGRSMETMCRAVRAHAGRLVLLGRPALHERLSAPLYVEAGSALEGLLIDPHLRGKHASYWSIPFRDGHTLAVVAQFGFASRYEWLPRELTLLEACGERCIAALRRVRLVSELADGQEQVRRLVGHLIVAGEEERRRISRELHDEVGQTLLVLRLEVEKLERDSEGGRREGLVRAREMAEHAISELRRAIAALNPAMLERLGLRAALRQMAARLFKPVPVSVRWNIADELPSLPDPVEIVIYRLAQECCQNVVRHAGASRVKLSLVSSDGWVRLSVADDGAGFDVGTALRKPDSFGLAGMRERVAQLGGAFHVRSRAGRGTCVVARLPIPAPDRA